MAIHAYACFGAECNSFVRFAHSRLLPTYGAKLGARRRFYVAGMDSLSFMLDICRLDRVLRATEQQDFCRSIRQHCLALHSLDIPAKPKHH